MERRLVYDSDAAQPGHCPTCGKRLDRCACGASRPAREAPRTQALPRDGVVRILRDRKGRVGKTVTLVAGLPCGVPAPMTRALKRLCGTGGTARAGVVLLQGDVRERVRGELERRGYQVKLAGG